MVSPLTLTSSFCVIIIVYFHYRTWDTLHYGHAVGSTVSNIPHFFNISLCGSIRGGNCSNSSVCYSESLETFYNLGNTSSCQYHYQDRQVTFTFRFSSESSVKRKYGSGNVSVTLICGRTLVSVKRDTDLHTLRVQRLMCSIYINPYGNLKVFMRL